MYGSVQFGANTISGGDGGGNVELMLNMPLAENLGLRGVVYSDSKAGWIDNVAGTRDASGSARWRPEGTVRLNGEPVASFRAGSAPEPISPALSSFRKTTATSRTKHQQCRVQRSTVLGPLGYQR